MTVSRLAIMYLLEVVKLSGEQAIEVWDYHLRNHAYARKAKNQEGLRTKVLGQKYVDKLNLSAYGWLTENDPLHPWVKKYKELCSHRKWRERIK